MEWGKSTLAKIIVGEIKDSKGQVSLGHNVQLGYFARIRLNILMEKRQF
ncbi:ABC transporter ATP-binding protein [Nonlabens ulvanivorans]|nr:ABC transporter ATP-binding protein [Nonlabens ulvanivorans]